MGETVEYEKLKTELEWIHLRDELAVARQEDLDERFPIYKKKWYIAAGVAATIGGLSYGIFHFNNHCKSFFGMSFRISAQLVTVCLFLYSFKKFEKERTKKYKTKNVVTPQT